MMIATVISRMFDPILVFSAMILLVAARSGFSGEHLLRFFLVFCIGMLLPPVAFLVLAIKKKWVSNWDISNRRQRIRVLGVFSFFLLADYLLINTFVNIGLQRLFLFFIIWFLGFFGITLFWKISGHVAAATLASSYIVDWFGFHWWPVFLAIPLVAWARVVTKNHTITEVVGGVLYSLIVYEIWQSIF